MQYSFYTMQPGDTLQQVAEAYRLDTDKLLAANPQLISEAVIYPGVVIALPLPVTVNPGPCTGPLPVLPGITWPENPGPAPAPWPTPQPEPTPLPEPTPSPEPTPLPEPTPGGQVSSEEQAVVELVNSVRANRGLPLLSSNSALSGVASAKSEDMALNNYFDHISPTYGSPFQMLQSFGFTYTAAGENIAKGQTTAQAVMNSWMNSSGHAANILSTAFTEIGVGYAYNRGVPIWTQMFIHP